MQWDCLVVTVDVGANDVVGVGIETWLVVTGGGEGEVSEFPGFEVVLVVEDVVDLALGLLVDGASVCEDEE